MRLIQFGNMVMVNLPDLAVYLAKKQ